MIKIIYCLALSFISISAFSQTIVIKGGEIYTGLNQESFIGDILIEGDTILEVSTKPLKGDVVVDASNKIITPGVIAPDTQIGILEIGAISETRDGDSDIYSMGFSVFDAINPNSTLIPWNRSNGVTSAITLPDFNWDPLSGMASFLLLDGSLRVNGIRDVALTGEIGALSSGSRAESLILLRDLLEFASILDGKDMASSKKISEAIEDFEIAELMDLQPRDVIALYNLLNNNLPLIIKTNRASDILKLIDIKKLYGLNLVLMSAQEATLVADEIAANNIPVIVNPFDNIPDSFDELASNIRIASSLEKAGIKVMFSESRTHNYHLIRQGAGNAVANGMSYTGAIMALTSNVAKSFNIPDRGLLQNGMKADIVIWEDDPLEPSTFPVKVFINGNDMDLTTRSSRLTERYVDKRDLPNTYK
ncbi:MAG: amidohydrolase family protein [Gammaproteobacteria bacterium]|tara:strand:+ start:734 stop:1993 length:1260 start_codon:yes stop_codon:yes gene_type:complete